MLVTPLPMAFKFQLRTRNQYFFCWVFVILTFEDSFSCAIRLSYFAQ